MINNKALEKHLDALLESHRFKDYAPNGLQVEGRTDVKTIVTGVTASEALIAHAIQMKADALLVHHGYFWKGEKQVITGIKKARIQQLLKHDINLYAYHLPLDCHMTLGNNIQLATHLGIKQASPELIDNMNLLWHGELQETTLDDLACHLEKTLGRKPQCIRAPNRAGIQRVAWCTGGAQNLFEKAIALGVDVFISGEVSEQTYHMAIEANVHFIAAGHHATERYGVKALGAHLKDTFALKSHYFEIPNPI